MTLEQVKWIRSVYADAAECGYLTGIPPLFIIANAALCSDYGASVHHFNYFWLKAYGSWKGDKQLLETSYLLWSDNGFDFPCVIAVYRISNNSYMWIVKDWFRVYKSPFPAFMDFAATIIADNTYKEVMRTGNTYAFSELCGDSTIMAIIRKLKELKLEKTLAIA